MTEPFIHKNLADKRKAIQDYNGSLECFQHTAAIPKLQSFASPSLSVIKQRIIGERRLGLTDGKLVLQRSHTLHSFGHVPPIVAKPPLE